jgi:GST-like protein
MIIRSTRNCPNTPRALFALEEVGVPYEVAVESDGWFTANVGCPGPILEDGALRVIEINAVLRHLGRAHPQLMPADLAGQAEMDRWLEMYRRIGQAVIPKLKPDQVLHLAGFLDRALDGRDWMLGAFSIVDCSYLAMAFPPVFPVLPLAQVPRFAAYLERLRTHPAAQRGLSRRP